jgi:hypothetical protein
VLHVVERDYLRAAQQTPALNNYCFAVSIVQDEPAHAHIGYDLVLANALYDQPARPRTSPDRSCTVE